MAVKLLARKGSIYTTTQLRSRKQVNFGNGKENGECHQKTASLACARQMPVTEETVSGQKIHREKGCHSSMQGHYLHFSVQSQKEIAS